MCERSTGECLFEIKGIITLFYTKFHTCRYCKRLHHMNNNTIIENVSKLLIISSSLLIALLVSFSRIYLEYHSISQVLCGALVGILFATFWFALTCFIFTPLFPQIVTWKVSEFLLLRDTTLIPNVLWFEYTNTRQEVRARSRKLVSMKSQ